MECMPQVEEGLELEAIKEDKRETLYYNSGVSIVVWIGIMDNHKEFD